MKETLSEQELHQMDGYFRAVNYLSCAQLYLKENPLLHRPLEFSDVKKKLVGHWGTAPGQNFVYSHLNRVIKKYDLNMLFVSGPGHGGQALTSNTYLEGSYSQFYPEIEQNEKGMKLLCKQFSFPGGIGSHATPETPGSINEGGELGYSLAHSFGAVFDNPDLIVTCVVGDGEAETGPLAASWHANKFISPKTDGAVLPVLHLNGYKIANPTIFARISEEEIESYFKGCGWTPFFVSGDEPLEMHQKMATVMDEAIEMIKNIWEQARTNDYESRPLWPMIVLRTPKGWTGPKEIDGRQIEGSFRAHQVPVEVTENHPESLKRLEDWLHSYKPEELFSKDGQLLDEYKTFIPELNKTMGMNIHANGGLLTKEIKLPNVDDYAVEIGASGSTLKQDMSELGAYVRDVVKMNPDNFQIFGPDEALSNRLNHVFEVTNRQWNAKILPNDEFLNFNGRVIDSMLSEHLCEGWLEGYNLTGRYGFFHSYEAFVRIVDSMASQHAKWLKMASEIEWRKEIPSLNYILTSHAWQQDHNGYTHQNPGFLNHLMTHKADIIRAYLPADANSLIATFAKIVPTKNLINVIVASKHPRLQWLSMEQAKRHVENGLGIWDFASHSEEPDLVMASAGDTPTLEILAAIRIFHKFLPNVKLRMVNIVDIMKLQPEDVHPHGLDEERYNYIFTTDKPIIFAFHGYPNLIHELTYKRANQNLHVRGYIEEGTITTPFDMRVLNKMDRYNLVLLALKHLNIPDSQKESVRTYCNQMLQKHKEHIYQEGKDLNEIENWTFERGEDFAN